jgi:hypothetical protein
MEDELDFGKLNGKERTYVRDVANSSNVATPQDDIDTWNGLVHRGWLVSVEVTIYEWQLTQEGLEAYRAWRDQKVNG